MQITEVQVGDWILHSLDDKEEPIKIKEIHGEVIKDEIGEGLHISNCEPILLTPEILEKNGFYLDYYENPDFKCWIRDDFVFGENGEVAIGIQRGWQNTYILYVHQLQQILRLCGITREIVL